MGSGVVGVRGVKTSTSGLPPTVTTTLTRFSSRRMIVGPVAVLVATAKPAGTSAASNVHDGRRSATVPVCCLGSVTRNGAAAA